MLNADLILELLRDYPEIRVNCDRIRELQIEKQIRGLDLEDPRATLYFPSLTCLCYGHILFVELSPRLASAFRYWEIQAQNRFSYLAPIVDAVWIGENQILSYILLVRKHTVRYSENLFLAALKIKVSGWSFDSGYRTLKTIQEDNNVDV
ncbi:MAG: hypothetical protein ACYCQJ_14545 [Nitrososphaerales archaeon]